VAAPLSDLEVVKNHINAIQNGLSIHGKVLHTYVTEFLQSGASLEDPHWISDPDMMKWKDSFGETRAGLESLGRKLDEAQSALRSGADAIKDLAIRLRPRENPELGDLVNKLRAAQESAKALTQPVVGAVRAGGTVAVNPQAVAAAAEAAAPEALAAAEANLPGIASAVEANAAAIANAGQQFIPQVAAQVEQNAPVVVPVAVAAGTAAATAAEGGGVAAGAAAGSWLGPVGIAIGIGVVIGIGWWAANRDSAPVTQPTAATIAAPVTGPAPSPPPPPPIGKTGSSAQGLEAIPGTYGIDVSGDNTCPFFATSEGHQTAFDVTLDGTTVTLAFSGGAFVGMIEDDYSFGASARDEGITGTIRGQFVPSSDAVALRNGYFQIAAQGVQCSTTFTGQKQG